LERKLGVKDGVVVFLDRAPAGFDLAAPTVRRLPAHGELDLTVTFQTRLGELEPRLAQLRDRTAQAGMVWVCWPKLAAQKAQGIASDLDENLVRETGLRLGLVDVKVAAIDATWSGLKFVRRLADRH
jgi:hypothetical protein